MIQLPDTVKKAILKQDVFPVATCSREGTPNVIYVKYLKVIDDETVVLADNYFHKTRDNIQKNPNLAFVVLDEEKGSFQIKGSVQWSNDGPLYDDMLTWVPDKFPRIAAVVLHVEKIYNGAEQLV
ncbi:MAG: pyridoxamine 5'-phosphate oxidase family protein [Sedimentisphaerales bacterium]|nr:pyridoxamine 5'-phosphate oxidase family protein [Sedimentisphaerales bacterium]